MKKIMKFGFTDKDKSLILKAVLGLIAVGVIIGMILFIKSELSKGLGWIPHLFGSFADALSSCTNCSGAVDSNGKKLTEDQACPKYGIPFFNTKCGGLLMIVASSLLFFAAFVAILLRLKGGRSSMSDAAKTQGNVDDPKQVKIAQKSIDDVNEIMDERGDDLIEDFKDQLEISDFKVKWNADHPTNPVPDNIQSNHDDFNSWVQKTGSEAQTLQSDIRQKLDKNITKQDIIDSFKKMNIDNSLHEAATQGTSSDAQRNALQAERTKSVGEQGAAMARQAGIDEDAGRSVTENAADDSSSDHPAWEDAVR